MAAPDLTGTTDGPFVYAKAITPSDTQDHAFVTQAIYVGGAGDISFIPMKGDGTSAQLAPVVLKAVPVGTTLRIRASRVTATGTSATLLVGLA